MKKMRRFLSLFMCIVLSAVCLAGCGGKSDEALLTASVKNLNEAKNCDITAKMSGKMKVSIGDFSQDVDMDMDITSTMFMDPVKTKVVSTLNSAGTSVKSESYIAKENDKYVTYTKVDDEWSKMELGNMDEAMAVSGMDTMAKQLVDDISKYVKKDDQEKEGKKYLVYDYTISGDAIKDMIKSMSSSMGSSLGLAGEDESQMEEILNAMVKEVGDITMTIFIDRETENISHIEYSMTEFMNKMMKSLMGSISDLAKAEGGEQAEIPAMNIETSDMNMKLSYSNINSAADFEIPKEALEAKDISELDGESQDGE